jgi:hypothetical protein
MSDDRDVGYSIFFFGFGVWYFFKGFKCLRRKRKIENIPTSTVRGLAIGLVELIGKTKKSADITSPLTGTGCVFYRYTVEQYQQSGRSGHWVVVAKGDSFACPFWLDDGTGRILVFPKDAELIMPADYEYETGLGRALPPNLTDFLKTNNIRYRAFLGNYRLRFREWHVCEDETVYVLGSATTAGKDNYLSSHNEKLIRRLEELKNNPEEFSKVDVNKDGEISIEEWDSAVGRVEQKLLEEEMRSMPTQEQIDVIINKDEREEVFIISDYSQKDLLRKLSWQSFCGVFGGAALALAMLTYILFRLNGFRF